MAAFTSAVRKRRKRSYWLLPGITSCGCVTPVTPSMSAEIKTLKFPPRLDVIRIKNECTIYA
jgi:hypothetical protein